MRWIWCLSLFLTTYTLQAQDGALNNVRSEVRTLSSDSSKSKSCDDDSGFSLSFGDSDEGFPGEIFLGILASPFIVPASSLHDEYLFPGKFTTYPYAEGWKGQMQTGPGKLKYEDVVPNSWENLMTMRASFEEGNNFNGINRLGITFLADTTSRFGIGGGVHLYEENHQNCFDRLAIGDINVLFRFAQSNKTQFRAGVGTRFLSDQTRTDWGVNFVYGFECFPREPFSLGAQVETGTLGNAWVFRATGRIGLVWKYSEVYAGYDYLQIGNTVLQGPMVGLRLWF